MRDILPIGHFHAAALSFANTRTGLVFSCLIDNHSVRARGLLESKIVDSL